MNATFAPPRTLATISLACPWCDEPLAVDDLFSAPGIRCAACATSVDLEPMARAVAPAIEIAA